MERMETERDEPLHWEHSMIAFLRRLFLLEMRDLKELEFVNLRQGSISVREYASKSQLCKMLQQWFFILRQGWKVHLGHV